MGQSLKEIWKNEFIMNVKNIYYVLGLVGGNLGKIDTFRPKAIKIVKGFVIIIWIFSKGKVFELGTSNIIKIYLNGINVIVQLAPNFISFLDMMLTAEDIKILHEFSQCSIPQVCGDINGTHIATLSTS